MPPITTPPTSPPSAAAIVLAAEEFNRAAGHENAGPLTLERGFTPARAPELRFPATHQAWDDVARDLPSSYARLTVRRHLEHLPDLSAEHLPDQYLQRAATVLGILVHAYHRVEPRRSSPTPTGLDTPWREVNARLGRATPNLAYLDLIVANWRFTGSAETGGALRMPDVELLVPTVGTPEEQVFYLTQLDMLDRGTPLVGWAARACEAVAQDDPRRLAAELERMAGLVGDITRFGLPRIEPRPGRPFHVDPVVWAKTVAPLAVPLRAGDLGPSGTASPMFALLDAVVGRGAFASLIGDETVRLMADHPRHWREFVHAVALTRISEYAEKRSGTAKALTDLRQVYAGRQGLLWRHRLKALGYLDTAFRVGRDVTISNFPALRTVSEALAGARVERPGASPDALFRAGPSGTLPASELLRHHRGSRRQWVALGGDVLDVTDFLSAHPGGVAPLATYLGTDASAAFAAIGHHEDAGILRRAARLSVGRLAPPDDPELTRWLTWAFTITQWANVLVTDLTIRDGYTSIGAPPGELTPYTLQFTIEAHERFLTRVEGAILAAVADLTGAPAPGSPPQSPHPLYARLENAHDPADLAATDLDCRALLAADQTRLHMIRELLVDGVEALEQNREPTSPMRQLARLDQPS